MKTDIISHRPYLKRRCSLEWATRDHDVHHATRRRRTTCDTCPAAAAGGTTMTRFNISNNTTTSSQHRLLQLTIRQQYISRTVLSKFLQPVSSDRPIQTSAIWTCCAGYVDCWKLFVAAADDAINQWWTYNFVKVWSGLGNSLQWSPGATPRCVFGTLAKLGSFFRKLSKMFLASLHSNLRLLFSCSRHKFSWLGVHSFTPPSEPATAVNYPSSIGQHRRHNTTSCGVTSKSVWRSSLYCCTADINRRSTGTHASILSLLETAVCRLLAAATASFCLPLSTISTTGCNIKSVSFI